MTDKLHVEPPSPAQPIGSTDDGAFMVPLRVARDGALWTLPERDIAGDDDKLLLAHVLYDIEMVCGLPRAFFFSGRAAERDFPERSVRRLRGNALMDAFLLHARSLDEFLYKDQTVSLKRRRIRHDREGFPVLPSISSDDVMAVDFVADPQAWLDSRPPRDQVLKEARFRMDKAVMHLNRKRVREGGIRGGHDPSQKTQWWSFTELIDAFVSPLEALLPRVSPELREPFVESVGWAINNRAGPTNADWDEMKSEWDAQNRSLGLTAEPDDPTP